MGLIESGKVTGQEVKVNRDATKQERLMQVEITAPNDVQTVELMSHTGEESNPPIGSKVTVLGVGEAWKLAVASGDKIVPSVAPGEKMIYSTDDAGEVIKAKIHCKNDGTVVINNDNATITISPSGTLSITCTEDVVINANGVSLNGNGDNLVMWAFLNNKLQGLIVDLNNHTHAGPTPDQTFALDITNARANTLSTDG